MFYDSHAFNELINRAAQGGEEKPKMRADLSMPLFKKYLNFEQFEKHDHLGLTKKFALSFTTDGKKCSLSFRKIAKAVRGLPDNEYDIECGVDMAWPASLVLPRKLLLLVG